MRSVREWKHLARRTGHSCGVQFEGNTINHVLFQYNDSEQSEIITIDFRKTWLG